MVRWTLILTLVIVNLAYISYLIWLVVKETQDPTLKISTQTYLDFSLFCWVVSTAATLILVAAISYSIYVLKRVFPDQDHSKIFYILAVFTFAFVFRMIYEWSSFSA